MSAEELRKLVAQLQEDLMETARQKEEGQGKIQTLQQKLEATENTVRHISRKFKSCRPSTTAECFPCHTVPTPRRAQSETSVHRDRWSKIHHGMLNDGGTRTGCQGFWYGGPLRRSTEWEPHNCNLNNGIVNPHVTNNKTKSLSGLEGVKTNLPSPPSPRLQRIKTLSSSCILAPHHNHSPNGTQRKSFVEQANQNAGRVKTPPNDINILNGVDRTSIDANNNEKAITTSFTMTTHPSTNSSTTNNNNNDNNNKCRDHLPLQNVPTDPNPKHNGNNSSNKTNSSLTNSPISHQYNFQNSPKQSTTINQQRSSSQQKFQSSENSHDTHSINWAFTHDDNLDTSATPYCFTTHSNIPFGGKDETKEHEGRKERDIGGRSFPLSSKPEKEILTQLQHLLGEKEEMWRTKTTEIKLRMQKENFLLMQENELLHEEVKLLQENVHGKDRTINELKHVNEVKTEDHRKLVEEMNILKKQKVEIEEYLANQDKELTDLDKTICKLEITKKESDIQKRRKIDELEEIKKELNVMKKELQHYKEINKSLKDSLIKREASLQEQVFTVKKLRAERNNERRSFISITPDVIKTERNFQRTNSLNEKHSGANGGHDEIKTVYGREGQQELLQRFANLQEELRISQEERLKLKSEKERTNVNFNLQIADMEKQVEDKIDVENRLSQAEFELKSKKGLDEEIASLRSQLEKKFRHEMRMRNKVAESEAAVSQERTQLLKIQIELKEKADKVKKRDRQCQELCEKFGKLDSAYIKQTKLLQEKTDTIDFLKKRLQFYEASNTGKYSNMHTGERTIESKL